jgi:hypothetical protein
VTFLVRESIEDAIMVEFAAATDGAATDQVLEIF